MTDYDKIDETIRTAAQKARDDKAAGKSKEEINADFFETAIDLWNEEMAGEITLADGRKITIPKI